VDCGLPISDFGLKDEHILSKSEIRNPKSEMFKAGG